MQNRLLKDLADWATRDDETLREKLTALMGHVPEDKDMRRARRLFALSLEARGGLKIHTIHGFCERLLQRFPLESAVTPHFTVLDEQAATLLKRVAFDAVIARAAENRESALGIALDKIITVTGEEWFRQVVDTVLAKRAELDRMMAHHDGLAHWAEAEGLALRRLFGVADDTDEALVSALAVALDDAAIDTMLSALVSYGSTQDDAKTENGLRGVLGGVGEARATALRLTFLTNEGKPRARVCSKGFRDAAPQTAEALEDARDRVAALDLKLALLRAADASSAVLALADAIQDDYARRKQAEAALDYDDLIVKAAASSVARGRRSLGALQD